MICGELFPRTLFDAARFPLCSISCRNFLTGTIPDNSSYAKSQSLLLFSLEITLSI
jgi:hypothetical protein